MNQKKILFALAFALCTGAHAQGISSDKNIPTSNYPEAVRNIPTLNAIAGEIEWLEYKTDGKTDQYKNLKADRRALKLKYSLALKDQITANKDNTAVTDVLKAELAKTENEIKELSL